MTNARSFFNLYDHNFVRVAAAIPQVLVADPAFNAKQTIALMREAAERKALLVTFPELGLSAYSCEDLFHQQALLDASRDALAKVVEASAKIPITAVVGVPLVVDSLLFNCAAVVRQGRILGLVPKTYLPNYREFYELRQFTPADHRLRDTVDLCGQRDIPFGNRLLFQAEDQPLFTFFVEICEDLWVPIPPSSYAAMAGAAVLVNISASNITVAKAGFRRLLVADQSGRCLAAYVYCAAGEGESTTDLAWDGQALIYENGSLVAESERFLYRPHFITGDIDLDRLAQDRMRQNTFAQSVHDHLQDSAQFRTIRFSANLPAAERLPLERSYERFPYVLSDPAGREERCKEVYEIQAQGLVKRLQSSGINKVVIGVSGGLDSTQALLVCAHAVDVMKLSRKHILAYTMPGFATTERTLQQARRLMSALGCQAQEIDIRPSCMQMLKDIGHPFASGHQVFDATFENVQAGERTSHLFRLANQNGGLVVGTSDLSELALGYCTYGVGDHMAHYGVNASVPKTLNSVPSPLGGPEQAARSRSRRRARGRPGDYDRGRTCTHRARRENARRRRSRRTLRIAGLQSVLHAALWVHAAESGLPGMVGLARSQAGTLARCAGVARHEYSIGEIKRWLKVFLERFFKYSQFKRSAVPNAPKVGSGGSLSPRSDYRAPSDSEATAWLAQLDRIPDTDS